MPKFTMELTRESRSKLGRIKKNALRNAREAKYARNAAYNAGRQMRRQFAKTVRTWDHNVVFKLNISGQIGSNVIFYTISTTDQIWHWLDKGTEIRFAKPKNDETFTPKTFPTVFNSFPGTGKMVRSKEPRPGIIPRNWSSDKRTRDIAKVLLESAFNYQMKKFKREMRGE